MENSLFSKEKVNRCKKKIIPWHVQKRYMESLSQLSLNQTIATAFYKREIKSLKKNNKHLALALQRSRCLATDKENLLIDNGKILDIVTFSRLKLMDMATNMKQATACLDETLLILNSAIVNNSSKCSTNNRNYRNDFKNKLQELKIESIKEVMESASENSNSPNKNAQSCVHKGKISRVDDCISPPNKKCKLGKKAEKIKRNCKNVPKSAEKTSATLPNTAHRNASLKDSKKCGSALNIKSQRKKSLPKSSNIEPPSSLKLPTSSSNLSLQAKNKQKYQDKKCKVVNVVLTDIAEAFVNIDIENYYSPETNEPISSIHCTNFKCFEQNSAEDNMLIKKYISSEITSKQKSSAPNSYSQPFASTINDAGVPNCSQNTSNSSNFSLENFSSTGDIPVVKEEFPALPSEENEDFVYEQDIPAVKDEFPALPSEENEDFVYEQTSAVVKMHQIEEGENNAKQNNGRCIKNNDLEKDKRSYKSRNSVATRRVQFYFDEDSIESVDGETTASKNRIRKCMNKCKARKTVSNVKKNIPSKSTALKSNCILPDNVSKLGKNSFLVTAEVHSPPNGIYTQEMKSKMCVTEKREPCVVLTDIFKSNQGLLSEMVGNGLRENGCLQNTITNSAETPLATFTVNDFNSAFMDFESNAENRCLPEDRKIIEKRGQRRRANIVSYKEPSLHTKMRRLF